MTALPVKVPMSTKKIRKDSKYDPKIGQRLYELQSKGKSLVQVAKDVGVSRNTLYVWSQDETKPEFQEWYESAKEAYQAFYENFLDNAIVGLEKLTGVQEKLLTFKMRTQFKEDWAEHRTSTININDETKRMSDADLEQAIMAKIKQTLKLKPDLKVVDKKDGTDA